MFKLLKIIFYLIILLAVFSLGVKYSNEAKFFSNWIFEAKEKEIDPEVIKDDTKEELEENIRYQIEEEIEEDSKPLNNEENDNFVEGNISG